MAKTKAMSIYSCVSQDGHFEQVRASTSKEARDKYRKKHPKATFIKVSADWTSD